MNTNKNINNSPVQITAKDTEQPDFVKRIGKTTYKVKVHFSKTSKETMNDKIIRLLQNEVSKM